MIGKIEFSAPSKCTALSPGFMNSVKLSFLRKILSIIVLVEIGWKCTKGCIHVSPMNPLHSSSGCGFIKDLKQLICKNPTAYFRRPWISCQCPPKKVHSWLKWKQVACVHIFQNDLQCFHLFPGQGNKKLTEGKKKWQLCHNQICLPTKHHPFLINIYYIWWFSSLRSEVKCFNHQKRCS